MNIFYSLSGVREVIYLVFVPLFVTLLFYGLFVFFYSIRAKDEKRKNYVISFWSNVIGILFGAILLSVSIGFVIALVRHVNEEGWLVNNQFLYSLFCCFPVIPFFFLCFFLYKFVKLLRNKDRLDRIEEEEEKE